MTEDEDLEDQGFNAFRDGKVHVLADKCGTCIFRPGNLMHLQAGRVKEMVEESIAHQTAVVCHSTLPHTGNDQAVCRGFWDSYREKSQPLQMAERLGVVAYDPVPKKEEE